MPWDSLSSLQVLHCHLCGKEIGATPYFINGRAYCRKCAADILHKDFPSFQIQFIDGKSEEE